MAFRQPCQKIKTSAPIKASERKILKQQIIQTFSLSEEDGNLLVPDVICTFKFQTHAKEHGVAYASMDGEPLWFLLGRDSTEFIPTVYTLWKKANLLPSLYISPLLNHILVNGADLMTQGVVQKPNNIKKDRLVSITPHICDSNLISFPLAVGRMALDSDAIPGNGEGKAVHIIHIYEDNLWLMGSESRLPKPGAAIHTSIEPSEPLSPAEDIDLEDDTTLETPDKVTLPPEEVTSLLRLSTVQAIDTLLSTLPSASFPIPSSLLYSSYILPCRPAHVLSLGTAINIKNSTHKNLTSFLKTLEKEDLLKLKDIKGDLNILSVQSKHPEILQHRVYKTIMDVEEESIMINKIPKRNKRKRMLVRRFWVASNASNSTIEHLLELCRKDTKGFYTFEELCTVVNEYIAQHSLANPKKNQLIKLDQILKNAVLAPGEKNGPKSVKRGYIVPSLCKNMEPWYEITINGEEPVRRKGALKSIEVTVRGNNTLVKFFQPFSISPDLLSSELSKICSANATNDGKESPVVKVRGKHVTPVVDFLLSQGVPRRYISSA